MNALGVSILLATSSLVPPPQEPLRVGDVKIVGNTITRDNVIRYYVCLYPGMVVNQTVVRQATKNLIDSGLFEVDPANDEISPKVTIEGDKAEVFKSIVIRVREKKQSRRLRIDARLDSRYLPVIRLLVEEPNFDPARWPISLDDIREDRAFRGAGKLLRVELVRLNLLWGRADFFLQDVPFVFALDWWARQIQFDRDKFAITFLRRPIAKK